MIRQPMTAVSLSLLLAATVCVGATAAQDAAQETPQDAPQDAAVSRIYTPVPIAMGETLEGELSTEDARLPDLSRFDCFELASPGEGLVQIEMTSEAFDTFLMVTASGCNARGMLEFDGDAGRREARIIRAIPQARVFIMANTYDPAGLGAYRLTVSPAPEGAEPTTRLSVDVVADDGAEAPPAGD